MLNGLDLRWIQACMRIRWILSKKITILILSFIGVGAIAYNYLMQFKNISFDAFEQEEEDEFKD
jgi:Tfp pilus assembly protein PilO